MVNRWISVKERLPDKPGKYLVVDGFFKNTPTIGIALFVEDMSTLNECKWVWNNEEYKRPGFINTNPSYSYEMTRLTHWMPLPELPKEE